MGAPVSAQEEFDSRLAPYAVRHDNSFGRRQEEAAASDRNEFQRDTSRILHSGTFRSLQHKTQVFSNHDSNLFRTRLTHSLEVAQVSRASARALRLNEDLVETISLAHDLGHAPFGYLGQEVLNEAMREKGGFEHNLQALRIVDSLERAYSGFKGLNLLFESREGILKHCSARNARLLMDASASAGDSLLGTLASRFLSAQERPPGAHRSASLEAQLTDFCDEIAFTHADMEDAVTMGIVGLDQLADGVPLFKKAHDSLRARSGPRKAADDVLFAKEASGMMMKHVLGNLIEHSKRAIAESGVATIRDVRQSAPLIGFDPELLEHHHRPFKQYLREEVYEHPDVQRWRGQQKEMMKLVFSELAANPTWWDSKIDKGDKIELHRKLCDTLAAMTDRSFTEEFQRVRGLGANAEARKALVRKRVK